MIAIRPQVGASQRTKNRIREHGPNFILKHQKSTVLALEGRPGIFVQSANDDWMGWFPTGEIEIQDI